MSSLREEFKQYITDFGDLDYAFKRKFREKVDAERFHYLRNVAVEVIVVGIVALLIMFFYHGNDTENIGYLKLRLYSVIAFIIISAAVLFLARFIEKKYPASYNARKCLINSAWLLWILDSLLVCYSFAAVMNEDQLEYASTMMLFVMTFCFYSFMRAYVYLVSMSLYCMVFVGYAIRFDAPATMYVYILIMYILALMIAIARYIPLQDIFAESQRVEKSNERLQDLVQVAVAKANEASSARGDFFARASHDMRTPMNGILGLIHLTLQEEGLSSVVRDNLGKMDITGRYLLNLINDLLDLQKIEDGKIIFKPEPVRWMDFLDDVMVVFDPAVEEKGIDFRVDKKNISDCNVNIDTLRVQQIFTNLVSNAIKFTEPGGSITCTIEETGKTDGRLNVRFTVKDNGIGMTEEFQKHIFEPFSQEDNGISAGNGTGLGMAIVKKITEMMNGSIRIDSVRGSGTVAVVELGLELTDTNIEKKEKAEGDMSVLKGKRVLLCEDNPLNMEIAQKLLEIKGMIVEPAENGKIGVEKFEKSPLGYYSLILMDIRMPIMNGYDATRAIRALRRSDAGTIPIVAMSANAFREDIDESIRSGMNDHLIKPIVVNTLYNTVQKFVSINVRQSDEIH